MAKNTLPAEVHDHFRKANLLHGYVEERLGEAIKHALEAGQELLTAKSTIPHGSWEKECDRLFDGSARNARFYMEFAANMAKLPKRRAGAVLLLEHTLKGAAKAVKEAVQQAGGKKPRSKPPEEEIVDAEFESVEPPEEPGQDDGSERIPEEPSSRPPRNGTDKPADYGKCPNCAGTTWDDDEFGVSCAKCHHPHGEPAGDVDEGRLKTQRQKTVKTIEALMRAFDDLQCMLARPEHEDAIDVCKELLAVAKEWT